MRFLTITTAFVLMTPLANAQTPPPFACKVSTSHSSATLKPASASETYMQSAQFEGLEINTYQNEDGASYSVTVSREKTVLAQADIVMYADTSLKLNTGKEMIKVQCMTSAAPAPTEITTP